MKYEKHMKWIFYSLKDNPKNATPSNNLNVTLSKIFIHSFLKVNAIYVLQFLSFFRSRNLINSYIILGSQAPHHHMNAFRFLNLNPNQATLINAFNKTSITSVKFIGLISLYKEFIKNFSQAVKYILHDNTYFSSEELVKNLASSIPSFTYLSLLFKNIKSSHPNINVYSGGADLASMAAIKGSLETHYLSHGLLGASATADGNLENLIEVDVSHKTYPEYSSIYVYSEHEKNVLQSNFKETIIHSYKFPLIRERSRKAILFLETTEGFFDEERFLKIIKFFTKNNIVVMGKEHPANESQFPVTFCKENDIVMIPGDGGTAYEIIVDQSPMFTIGWPSTSLCESLNMGIIPICIPSSHPFFQFKSFYPFQSKTLSWSKDLVKIEQAILDNEYYDLSLKELQKN